MRHSQTFQQFRARHDAAIDAGLMAAAYHYRTAVMRKLAHGYTSGRFLTGNVLNSVTVGPLTTTDGVRMIRVGTNVRYAAFWEFGFHQRLWTYRGRDGKWYSNPKSPTRFVRVPYWEQARDEARAGMSAAFARAYQGRLRQS